MNIKKLNILSFSLICSFFLFSFSTQSFAFPHNEVFQLALPDDMLEETFPLKRYSNLQDVDLVLRKQPEDAYTEAYIMGERMFTADVGPDELGQHFIAFVPKSLYLSLSRDTSTSRTAWKKLDRSQMYFSLGDLFREKSIPFINPNKNRYQRWYESAVIVPIPGQRQRVNKLPRAPRTFVQQIQRERWLDSIRVTETPLPQKKKDLSLRSLATYSALSAVSYTFAYKLIKFIITKR